MQELSLYKSILHTKILIWCLHGLLIEENKQSFMYTGASVHIFWKFGQVFILPDCSFDFFLISLVARISTESNHIGRINTNKAIGHFYEQVLMKIVLSTSLS